MGSGAPLQRGDPVAYMVALRTHRSEFGNHEKKRGFPGDADPAWVYRSVCCRTSTCAISQRAAGSVAPAACGGCNLYWPTPAVLAFSRCLGVLELPTLSRHADRQYARLCFGNHRWWIE